MSRKDKVLARLFSVPKDLTWDELIKLLSLFGYTEQKPGKTGGSRRRFMDEKENVLTLHEPHPGRILKAYAIRDVITHLREKGYIENE